ncbi:MAG TPA: hypothetical protein VEK36_02380 [Candidatus Paceibacterota bacterium]|nr:hypothetical protein [Candidatus Paceibacterota bacterium]
MRDIIAKLTTFVKSYGNDMFVIACVILISIISYNLGSINALKKTPIKLGENADILQALSSKSENKIMFFKAGDNNNFQNTSGPKDLRVVASKNSKSKLYHFTWCPGAKQIKEQNKIWFENETIAQQAGYTLAGNCQ